MGTGTLGAAVYELVFDTRQVAKMSAAEGQVVAATDGIEAATVRADASIMKLASDTGMAAGRISASYKEAGAGAEAGAAEVSAAAAKADAAGGMFAAGGKKAEGAWARFGRVGGGMGQLLGLGAAYFAVKGGLSWMKDAQQGILAVGGAIRATGHAAGVTTADTLKLSDSITRLTGNTRGENLQLLQLELRYKNIRNIGPGTLAIFDRTAMMVQDLATVTGRSAKMIQIAFGKLMNDPANNLTALGRAGVKFNKQQTDMIKSIEFGTTKFQGYNGVLGAQLYVLSQLSQFQGAAAKQQNSLTVQWKRAKDAIDAAMASVLKGLMPALVQLGNILARVAGFLGHHTTAVRRLIVAFVALKVAAIAWRLVMMTMRWGQWIAGFLGLATAANAESAAARGAAVSTRLFGASTLGLLGPIAAVGAAVAGLVLEYQSLTDAQNQAITAWNRVGTPQRNANAFYAQRVAVYERQGMSPADAKAKAAAETKRVTGLPGGMQGIAAARAAAKAPKVKLPTVPTPPANAGTGAGLLPLSMQIADAIAQRSGAKAQIAVLRREQTYLYDLLKKTHDPAKVLAIQQELTNVWSSLTGLQKAGAKKRGYTGIVPLGMALAYQKALQTKGLADDIKVLREQERYFEGLVKNHKLSGAKQLAAMTELTRIKKKLADDLKKQAAAQANVKHNFDLQMQAYVDTRGTFFSEFASSVFHSGGGGLEMGAGASTKNMTYNQNNHFAEPPKDRYKLSRQMQQAAAYSQ